MKKKNDAMGRTRRRIRKGDQVMVITGNDRGEIGTVLSCEGDRLVVSGINMRKKHVRRSQRHPKGDIITIERPIHISNVMLCVDEEIPVKLRARFDAEGNKFLCYKKGEELIDYRPVTSGSK